MYKHTIFISYSRKDIDVANQLAQDLEKAGFDAWWDTSGLKGGDAWVRTIQAALKASKYCVVVLSPDAVESEWVEKEYTYAIGQGLRVIPILHKKCEVSMALANIQYIDFRGKKYERGLQKLLIALEEGSRRPQKQELVGRPVKWKRVGAIAGVIAVLIALGAWLVPHAADFLSAWLSETPLSDSETHNVQGTPVFNRPPKAVISTLPTSGLVGETVNLSAADSTDDDGRIVRYDWDFGDGTTGSGVSVTHVYAAPGNYTVTLTVTDDGGLSNNAMQKTGQAYYPGMIYVDAGEFTMGSDEGDSDEQPVHKVYLDAFHIDKTEVPNTRYRECVKAGACSPPHNTGWYNDPTHAEHPVVYVDWNQATDYCQWMGYRLPTEAEWEKAARGTDGLVYPWGNEWDETKLNSYEARLDDTTAVGRYPAGASPYGALDMAGNVWEWVADWYDSDYYSQSPTQNPPGPDSGKERVLRGGSWRNNQRHARCAFRGWDTPGIGKLNVGFRCARGSP